MEETNILVVDDEKEIADLLEIYLISDGFHVLKAYSAMEGLRILKNQKVDLVLLDVMMPNMSGIEMCRKIRETNNIPIIIVSAKTQDIDKIVGLTTGADDYVSKPFNPLELMARVKSQLRRYRELNPAKDKEKEEIISLKNLEINKVTHQVTCYGESIKLTPIEFDILYLLASNPGRVFSTNEIFESVWHEKFYEANNTVMVHIRRLRGKMHDDTREDKIITTVWGVGYKIELNFSKNYGQKVIFYIVVSGLATLGAEWILWKILYRIEYRFRISGYRSILFGPDGMRTEYRYVICFLVGLFTFILCFYLLMRESIHYINRITEKVKDISQGDFDNPIDVRGNDELASMALNLNQMQKNIKDIMERERVAEHTKNDLVSSVAHDIRTPLTSILGYLGWIRDRGDLDEATREKYIEIVYEKAKRLEQLTNELFGFAKLEHNELKIHVSKLDLIQLMEQMLDEMTPSFVKHEIAVKFEHPQPSLCIEGDGELLARLFGNLLSNAVKYGKEGKQIRVRIEQTADWVVTKVTNYGHVIPRAELDAIFRKFYRTEQSRSRNTGGTGLGLAIVRQIAELHRGEVRVKSDLQGTVFEVDLPLQQTQGKVGVQE